MGTHVDDDGRCFEGKFPTNGAFPGKIMSHVGPICSWKAHVAFHFRFRLIALRSHSPQIQIRIILGILGIFFKNLFLFNYIKIKIDIYNKDNKCIFFVKIIFSYSCNVFCF